VWDEEDPSWCSARGPGGDGGCVEYGGAVTAGVDGGASMFSGLDLFGGSNDDE
jgi:hypothetical protein